MNKKYEVILFIIPGIAIMFMSVLVLALVPPPPVNQNMGVYDTLFNNYTENKCRECHRSGVADGHHQLVIQGLYQCTNCHPVITINGVQTVVIERDCMKCHGTIFYNMTVRRPHHDTQDAQERHCSKCHGNLVDDYDDGHYIPTYNVTDVTPDTKYKVINSSTGKKWGGCESCHEKNLSLVPIVYYNNKTHHNLGSISGFNPSNNTKCATCHGNHTLQFGADFIRYCERCHGVKSLHNIQYDYTNTSGQLGYGHIGNNWDCNGCHASYVAGSAPGIDIIVPIITSLSNNKIIEGESTILNISGKDFITNINNVTYTSVIKIIGNDVNLTLLPNALTSNQITVTVPSIPKGEYGVYALKNGDVKSNKLPLISTLKVIVNSTIKNGSIVTIKGSGFGPYDPQYNGFINVTIIQNRKGSVVQRNVQINNWSDTSIDVISSDAMIGDVATVNSLFGQSSGKVTNK